MFFRLILKARRINKYKQNLLIEKRTARLQYEKKNPKLTYKQKLNRRYRNLQKYLKKLCAFQRLSNLLRVCFNLRHESTLENFILKSIIGFMGGFFLTYIFFMFFVLQLNFKLSTAMIMCSIFGSILTIGLAFSYKVRCIVFLVLPQFFSKKGRQALLAYAYILAITGPAKNTLNNMSILGESLACGQEQLKDAVKQILTVIKKPFYAIRDFIKNVVKEVKVIVAQIKEILLTIKRIIMGLVAVIKSAFNFLGKIMNVCNREIGTPFQRCQSVFEDAIIDCNAKLGPLFNWLCNITYLVKHVCYIVKILDFLCYIVDFIKDVVSSITTKVKQFIRHVRTIFYVRIKFSHSYHFESNQSKSMAEITTGIVTEIKQRSSGLIRIFDFMSSAATIFFIFMIIKVIYYRQRFLTNERFDNKFITKDFREIDLKRAERGLETVLPLNHRERQQYITANSFRLVKKEKSQRSQTAMFLFMATLKLGTHMATDYSLYWIMTLMRYYGRFQSKIESPNFPEMQVIGEGYLASLLRSIVLALKPLKINLEIDTIPCLPDPIPPDYDRYIQIASLLALCWFLAVFEPYGLRFRHSVMCYYHPQRAKERAIWLYNNIMRSRSSFLKFARRQLRRKAMMDRSIAKITLMERIRAKLKHPIFQWMLRTKKQTFCLLCGEVIHEDFIKCSTPNCPGIFCKQCFIDLQNICSVCLDPIQYGDLSDISEEKDSSEDELEAVKKKKTRRKRGGKKSSKNLTSDDDDNDDENPKKKLLKEEEEGATSDFSSDFSYTYQTEKDVSQTSDTRYNPQKFKDVEKQNIPDEATMQTYNVEISRTTITTAFDFNSSSSLITEIDQEQYTSPSNISNRKSISSSLFEKLILKEEKERKSANERSIPSSSYRKLTEKEEEETGMYEEDFFGESIGLKLIKRTASREREKISDDSTNTSLITELQENMHPYVPRLDLTPPDQENACNCTFSSNSNSEIFLDKVKYNIIDEKIAKSSTPKNIQQNRSICDCSELGYSSSSNASSLISSLSPVNYTFRVARPKFEFDAGRSMETSSSSIEENKRKFEEKVRFYYRNIRKKWTNVNRNDRKRKGGNFFNRFLSFFTKNKQF